MIGCLCYGADDVTDPKCPHCRDEDGLLLAISEFHSGDITEGRKIRDAILGSDWLRSALVDAWHEGFWESEMDRGPNPYLDDELWTMMKANVAKHDAQVLRDAADYLDHDPGGNSASFKLRIRAQRVERGE